MSFFRQASGIYRKNRLWLVNRKTPNHSPQHSNLVASLSPRGTLCGRTTIFPDLFIRVPLDDSGWTPEFFVAYWNSPIIRAVLTDAAKTTSGIWKVNQGHIGSCKIPVPPHEEQVRIVAHLDSVKAKLDSLKNLMAETSAELEAMLPSILDKAFKGNI